MRVAQLYENTQLDFSWPVRKVALNEQVDHLVYSTTSETYVVGTTFEQDFKLPDDDELHPEWADESKLTKMSFLSYMTDHSLLDIKLRPRVAHGSIKLLNPITWKIIDR